MRLLLLLTGTVLFALSTLSFPKDALAQTTQDVPVCTPPNYPTDVRPEPHTEPTEVTFGMRVFDITEINDVNQTISIDIAFRMSWTDERLAHLAGCKLSIQDIWYPNIIMTNSGRVFKRWPETVNVRKGGLITHSQRISGTFSGYQHLKDFPFDQQKIKLSMVPLDWSAEKLVFKNDQQFTGIRYPLNISDWTIRGVEGTIEQFFFDSVNQEKSSYILTVSADRHASYYVWKVLMPMSLIVVMSWCVFWISPSEFGTQLGLSASSVLTMIAFIFATTSMMPVLGYFTLMDSYIALATVFVFLALIQSLVTGYLASRGKPEMAVRIDLFSRLMFPVVFVLTALSLIASSILI